MLAIPNYAESDYLVLSTRTGMVKKTRLSEYDTNRQGGIIAINLHEGDELMGRVWYQKPMTYFSFPRKVSQPVSQPMTQLYAPWGEQRAV